MRTVLAALILTACTADGMSAQPAQRGGGKAPAGGGGTEVQQSAHRDCTEYDVPGCDAYTYCEEGTAAWYESRGDVYSCDPCPASGCDGSTCSGAIRDLQAEHCSF